MRPLGNGLRNIGVFVKSIDLWYNKKRTMGSVACVFVPVSDEDSRNSVIIARHFAEYDANLFSLDV